MKRKLFAAFLISMALISSAIYAIFEVMESAMSVNERFIAVGVIVVVFIILSDVIDNYFKGVMKK